jgi:hypothetical protein
MATQAIRDQAQQLFDEMLANGLKLSNIETRCDQGEIDAVQALRNGTITAEQKQEYVDISFEVRRLAAQTCVTETLFPRRPYPRAVQGYRSSWVARKRPSSKGGGYRLHG